MRPPGGVRDMTWRRKQRRYHSKTYFPAEKKYAVTGQPVSSKADPGRAKEILPFTQDFFLLFFRQASAALRQTIRSSSVMRTASFSACVLFTISRWVTASCRKSSFRSTSAWELAVAAYWRSSWELQPLMSLHRLTRPERILPCSESRV